MKFMLIIITALVGLLTVNLVGIAATVAFTNDTNAVASGIEVEFSAPATVTWHSGEFSNQDPQSGFTTEFTFSGGTVNPGGTFMISWGPDTAKVVSHTWVTAASGNNNATTASTAASPQSGTAPAANPARAIQRCAIEHELG